MEHYENMPLDGRRYHLRLPEHSRRKRELLWKVAGGPPWERTAGSTRRNTLNELRKKKLNLLGRLDVRRKRLALMARI